MVQQRLLTGDTPTGRLHLGHWVGSLENRVNLQHSYESYFLIANMHAFTTRAHCPAEIRQNVLDIAIDYLSVGIDPTQSVICIQSEIPAISELTFLFSMLISYPRVLRNPTLKDEIRDKDLGEHYPFGFLLYPIGQVADILAFRPHIVPVGEDQLPHLEMTREITRKFNHLYCGVPQNILDCEHVDKGGLFPIIEPLVGRVKRLVGTGGPNKDGELLKMSKSLNNAILLSDTPDIIKKKVMQMYTDPNRASAASPGNVINNPLWIFHETFNNNVAWVEEAKDRYKNGKIGDVECKKQLIEVLVQLTEPFLKKRAEYSVDSDYIKEILLDGAIKANQIAEDTLMKVKMCIHQDFFGRNLTIY